MIVAVMLHLYRRRGSLSQPPMGTSFRTASEGAYNRAMEYAVGIDAIEIARVRRVLLRHPERFLRRVYTPEEVAFCRGRIPELAARFAAKEAVMKALGTGARGLAWREIEILPNRRGKPLVYLHGLAK